MFRKTLFLLVSTLSIANSLYRQIFGSRNSANSMSSLLLEPEFDVYLALGSNVGDRSTALNLAVTELKSVTSLQKTSFLYETVPMYHTDQRKFLNAVCHVRTRLSPENLLNELQNIERKVGREVSFRNGPRVIDLDILLYGDHSICSERLQIPHPRIGERIFVLTPLSDIAPPELVISHEANKPQNVGDALKSLPPGAAAEIRRVLPVHNSLTKQTRLLYQDAPQQRIMGILNVTPDRYSTSIQHHFVYL